MEIQKCEMDLGSIMCKACGDVIATFDSEKVTVYYSVCDKNGCREHEIANIPFARIGD